MSSNPSRQPARRATGPLQQLGAVLATDLPRLVRERRTFWLGVVQLFPVLAAILLIQWLSLDATHVYTAVVEWAIFPFLVPLIALFYGGPMLVDEIEQETITYLTLRPVPKWVLYSGKWIGGVAVAVALVVVPILLLWIVAALLGTGSPPDAGTLFNTVLASTLATAGYASVFAAIGVAFAKSVIGSIVYFVLGDLFLGQIPVFKLATVRFHVFNVGNFEQPSGAEVLGQLLNAQDFTVPWGVSLGIAIGGTILMIGVGSMIFSNRQYQL